MITSMSHSPSANVSLVITLYNFHLLSLLLNLLPHIVSLSPSREEIWYNEPEVEPAGNVQPLHVVAIVNKVS